MSKNSNRAFEAPTFYDEPGRNNVAAGQGLKIDDVRPTCRRIADIGVASVVPENVDLESNRRGFVRGFKGRTQILANLGLTAAAINKYLGKMTPRALRAA